MSNQTNPDRAYLGKECRATLRVEPGEGASAEMGPAGVGARLVNLSSGGCCLCVPRFELPFDLGPGGHLSSLKLRHPSLDSQPIKGRIAWAREEPPHVLLGVQFLRVQPETQASIRTFVETAQPVVDKEQASLR